VRLVAGVQDRTPLGGLDALFSLEEVGALRELEAGALTVLADADPPGAGDDRSGHQERR